VLHLTTWGPRTLSKAKRCQHIIKREPSCLSGTNEIKTLHRLCTIDAIVSARSVQGIKKPPSFVVAKCRCRDINQFSELSNRIFLGSHVCILPHLKAGFNV